MDSIALRNKMSRWNITCQTVAEKMSVTRATVNKWLKTGSPAYRDEKLKAVLASCKTKKKSVRRYKPRDGVWKPRAGDMTEAQLDMLDAVGEAGTYELVCFANVGAIPVLNALVRKGLVSKYEQTYELADKGRDLLASGETNLQKLSEDFRVELELSGIDPVMGQI